MAKCEAISAITSPDGNLFQHCGSHILDSVKLCQSRRQHRDCYRLNKGRKSNHSSPTLNTCFLHLIKCGKQVSIVNNLNTLWLLHTCLTLDSKRRLQNLLEERCTCRLGSVGRGLDSCAARRRVTAACRVAIAGSCVANRIAVNGVEVGHICCASQGALDHASLATLDEALVTLRGQKERPKENEGCQCQWKI